MAPGDAVLSFTEGHVTAYCATEILDILNTAL
jgi:hypothetical protein